MSQKFLDRKYILKRSENFDAYMKELGVGLTLRKMGNSVVSQCMLTKNVDKTYTFALESPYRSSIITFEMDKQFMENTLDSRRVETICHLDGNIFTQMQSTSGLKTTKIVREYKDDELKTTLYIGNVKAIRVYGALDESTAERKKPVEVVSMTATPKSMDEEEDSEDKPLRFCC